ncbi:hypothetical protein FIBSPDRAFT_931673 [Athelia psychrophila]|uniref:Uncharacterized protein n=1 Tax=Athelia psychrophila TaxID=1759441 RepID=A0A166K2T1_9AGAM|nr:hypothetical protein FIBSPDRAFT_931673 [Fibularhizoctonia sp. CBS 109695]
MARSDDPQLVITPSALMHASLAFMSPELLTLNTIIHLRSSSSLKVLATSGTGTASILSLPPEILLAIRVHLLHLLITHLTLLSSNSLSAYETTRRAQLCEDCLAYHTEIFGGDVWSWPVRSACYCLGSPKGIILAFQRASYKPVESLESTRIPPEPVAQQEWLEFYLSKRAKRIFAARQGPRASMRKGIWDLVSDVLHMLQCSIIRHPDNSSLFTSSRTSRALRCTVVPEPLGNGADVTCEDVHMNGRNAIVLWRLQTELGLSLTDADVHSPKIQSSHVDFYGDSVPQIKKNIRNPDCSSTPAVTSPTMRNAPPLQLVSAIPLPII